MSGKGASGRSKRSDKDLHSNESKHEGSKARHDPKSLDSRDRTSNLTDGRSPSHGRPDRNHNTKEKPYHKSKDRGGQDGKKREFDKSDGRKPGRIDFSGHKHGRDVDGERGSSGRDSGPGDSSSSGSKKQSGKVSQYHLSVFHMSYSHVNHACSTHS